MVFKTISKKSKISAPNYSQKNILSQGAEAIILQDKNKIIKDRISKSYRIPELDKKIIKQRTKSETKLLTKASEIINAPIPESQKEINKIIMPFINGKKLSEHLDKFTLQKQKQICKKIGESISKLHDNNIIHGDLTTSNMIHTLPAKEGDENPNKTINKNSSLIASPVGGSIVSKAGSKDQVFLIDFGLGYISNKIEDKAVDLHLLKQALEAKHFKNWEQLWTAVKSGYKSKDKTKILERLTAVERRGRYKH